jgi:2-(1,2-epoxy-1,2-dihydrophenyl)acetyl-CoA isomerase
MTEPLIYERDGALGHIRLNRPDVLNALNQPMADALLSACRAAEQDRTLRALLITGEGRSFMAGGDISTFAGDATRSIDTLMRALHDAIVILARLPLPVIALGHGPVAGAGLSFLLAADVVLAADDAKFLLAYSRLGASPDGGSTWHLPRAIGLRRALGLALLRASLGRDLQTQLDTERAEFLAGTFSNDFAEGVAAFTGKRKPTFTGR